MKSAMTVLLLTILNLTIFAQSSVTTQLELLSNNNEFDKIIEQFSSDTTNYSSKDYYYIGLAYYMKEDDGNCLKYMNHAIEKDSSISTPYYFKGSTLNYMKRYQEAITCFQTAVSLKNDNPKYYCGLGDSYNYLTQYDMALNSYQKASILKDCPDRAFTMIAQIYSDQNDKNKALEAYYIAKSRINPKSKSYKNALYNIGLLESLNGNNDKAEPIFMELLQIDSTDYQTNAKLIQIYYSHQEYDKAKVYKDKLYLAYKNGQLKGNMKDMFCFDQFKWNNKLIQAFERYENESTKIFAKNIFYVVDNDDKVEFKIQTEYSPISIEQDGAKYILCMTKGDTHSTYNIGFNDNYNYVELKKCVIDILEDKLKPSVSSTISQ